jgi:hypothetical protein
MKGEEGKGDLKGSREKPKTHAIERTGAFDCIHAKCVCETGFALDRIEYVRTHACRNVCMR